MDKIDYEKISLGIIANAGEAKSLAFDALDAIEEQNYELANNLIDEGIDKIIAAEKIHMDVISTEASGTDLKFSFLLMHAEDQLMSSQVLLETIRRFIEIFKKRDKK